MVARLWILAGVAVVLLAAGAAGAALLAWPQGAVGASSGGLAQISLPGFAGHIESLQVTDPAGASLPIALQDGTIVPRTLVAPGERLTVRVTFRRPSWIAWLVGHSVEHTYRVVTPVAHVASTVLRPKRGSVVAVRFDPPVSRFAIGGGKQRELGPPRSVVPLGVVATGTASAGTTTVAAAVRSWEKLSRPVRVSWFVAGPRTRVVAAPASGGTLAPDGTLTLTFSQPVGDVLGSHRPLVEPATTGRWTLVDAHTLSFQPSGLGFPLGGTVHVRLPRHSLGTAGTVRRLAWQVQAGSTLRLQEILARLGYLPVRWHGDASPPTTAAAELAAAMSPPTGHFSWRYPHTPRPLQALWKEGVPNEVTRSAVMRFEDVHGLATDGIAGPKVWRALLKDDLAGRRITGGYSYVLVHETIPQSLNLWHNGKFVLSSPGNTGIAQAPTTQGTWPVFEHIPVGTMSGTNPDGSHYNDPGIQWISYFHGGDAIHAFPRPSYGTPQSLGCVELPLAAAAKVWPYTPIGTLVTIES